jgi:hypothetical protein
VAVATVAAALSGCGSHSRPSTPAAPASTPKPAGSPVPSAVGGVSIRGLERALLTRGGSPPPTVAECRGATTAERHAAPFGPTRRPLFSCLLTVTGEQARYDVQVLLNGCYVAERDPAGQAVYGCGADRVAVPR